MEIEQTIEKLITKDQNEKENPIIKTGGWLSGIKVKIGIQSSWF
ncbi:hypothetical protein [Mesomycoplasma ovipneumoniae]